MAHAQGQIQIVISADKNRNTNLFHLLLADILYDLLVERNLQQVLHASRVF